MGLNYWEARLLWEARSRGVSFASTLTVARLSLNLHPGEVAWLTAAHHRLFPNAEGTPLKNYRFGEYADDFLRSFIGASAVIVMDYSAYEGATVIHDLNQPVPERLCGAFDAVIEGGSLEHIFNYPAALTNLMRLVKLGGTLFMSTPANNCCGHGFYQFSPELMYRVFSEANGFKVQRVILVEGVYPSFELTSNRKAYEVRDPAEVGIRIGLVSQRPVMMLVEATKIRDVVPFASPPLQSDYVKVWQQADAKGPAGLAVRLKQLVDRLPRFIQSPLLGLRLRRLYSLSNRRFYKRIPW